MEIEDLKEEIEYFSKRLLNTYDRGYAVSRDNMYFKFYLTKDIVIKRVSEVEFNNYVQLTGEIHLKTNNKDNTLITRTITFGVDSDEDVIYKAINAIT